MAKYVCIDVGGTFTDAVVLDETGGMNVFKAPTTPSDYLGGMVDAVSRAAEHYRESLEGLRVAIIGDVANSRVARSDIWCLTKLGAKVILCGPSTLMPCK